MNVVQYELMDFCTMTVSIAFILARPSPELHSDARPRKLLSVLVLVPWIQYATLFATEHGLAQVFVKRACQSQPEHCKVCPQLLIQCLPDNLDKLHTVGIITSKTTIKPTRICALKRTGAPTRPVQRLCHTHKLQITLQHKK